jgi:YaaC-like Protein
VPVTYWRLRDDSPPTVKEVARPHSRLRWPRLDRSRRVGRRRRRSIMSVGNPSRRPGVVLELNQREVEFSFFPAVRKQRQWQVSDTIFAVSPWAVMQGTIDSGLSKRRRDEPTAFLQQGREFYVAARERLSANPLLYYYAFLNIGKALLRVRRMTESLDQAHHGLGELSVQKGGGLTLDTAKLVVRDGQSKVHVFPAVMAALGYPRPKNNSKLQVSELLPQIVVGHRQWRDAEDQEERFVRVDVKFRHDDEKKTVWVCLYVRLGDLSRYAITPARTLMDAQLDAAFHQVPSIDSEAHCFELRQPAKYTNKPVNVVQKLAEDVRPYLWEIVSAVPGAAYRRYYLYLTPPGRELLPQIGSLWATLFYLGSVVRYRPHTFEKMIAGPYGPFITEFISAQPEQMLYMLASEMCRREVAQPAIAG